MSDMICPGCGKTVKTKELDWALCSSLDGGCGRSSFVSLYEDGDEVPELTNGTGTVSADLTIENVQAAIEAIRLPPPPGPRITWYQERWCIVIDGIYYAFPEGTTYEHVCSVLSEAMFLAEQRWYGDRGNS